VPYSDPEIRRLKAREYVSAYRRKHPEKISAYKEKTKHKAAGYVAAYRKRHPDRVKAQLKNRKPMTPEQKAKRNVRSKKKYQEDPNYRISQLARTRRNHLVRRYGITEEDRDALAKKQKHKCAVCRRETKLYIDHCHKSKKVRGLLCHKCNVMVGMAEDNGATLRAAAAYVEEASI